MLYADTDSQMLKITYTDKAKYMTQDFLYKNTFLKKYLDRSNFKYLSKESYCERGEIGYIKSELSDDIISEIIMLTPKCYSILAHDRKTNEITTKYACKGVPIRVGKHVYTHDVFRNILNDASYTIPSVTANYIRRNRDNGVSTIKQKKVCLSLIDNKRFWVNINKSYGFGHPETYKHGYKDSHVIAAEGARIKILDEYDNQDFYQEFFPDDSQYDNADFFSDSRYSNEDNVDEQIGEHDFFYGLDGDEPLIQNGETYNLEIEEECGPETEFLD